MAGIIEKNTQNQCHYCLFSWGLKGVLAPPNESNKYNNNIEDIYCKFIKGILFL